MSESMRLNPEFSVTNEKNEVKKQKEQMQAMRNRVQLLRQQLQREKDNIRKNKQLTKEAIQKKVEVNKINQWKIKDNSEEIERINQLRRRNQEVRMSHEKELQDIQKAIYLVKLDDARELKQQSDEHNRRIKEMERQFLSGQQRKKRRVAEESQAAKERYMQFWKDKLAGIYTEQAQNIVRLGHQKEENRRQLSQLEQEQLRLMEEINKVHSQSVQAKKEYMAALSLPVKEVAEAMGNPSTIARRQSMTINTSQVSDRSPRYGNEIPSNKMPSALVNEGKLKLVLQQLKKVDRNALHTSR